MVRGRYMGSVGAVLLLAAAGAGLAAYTILRPIPAEGQPTGPWLSEWALIMTGPADCAGHDVALIANPAPDPARCTPAAAGTTAICWGTAYPHPAGFEGCAYKNISPARCQGGGAPGAVYECVSRPPQPIGGPEVFSPWIQGSNHWDGGNYRFLYAPDPAACMAECGRDSRCLSVTYTSRDSLCWLQAGVGQLRAEAGAMAAAKRPVATPSPSPQFAGEVPSGPAPATGECEIAGLWRAVVPSRGTSEWWITEGGAASQIGHDNAAGLARRDGRRMTIDWKSPAGEVGKLWVELDGACRQGRGEIQASGKATALRLCREETCQ
jgi:hypothetical protein